MVLKGLPLRRCLYYAVAAVVLPTVVVGILLAIYLPRGELCVGMGLTGACIFSQARSEGSWDGTRAMRCASAAS